MCSEFLYKKTKILIIENLQNTEKYKKKKIHLELHHQEIPVF